MITVGLLGPKSLRVSCRVLHDLEVANIQPPASEHSFDWQIHCDLIATRVIVD